MANKKSGLGTAKPSPMDENMDKRKKKRRGRYTFYYLIFFLLVIGLGVYLSMTKYFLIEKVSVAGTNKYTEQEIIKVANIEIGSNLFRIDKDKIKKDLIDKFVYIEDVNVKIVFPPAIILQIKQAEPFALLKAKKGYLLVSEQGRVLQYSDTPVNTKMPVVMGASNYADETTKDNSSQNTSKQIDESKNESKNQNKNESVADSLSKINSDEGDSSSKPTDKKENKNAEVEPMTISGSTDVKVGDYLSKKNETLTMLTYLIEAFEKTDFKDVTKIDISDRLNMKIVYQDRLLIILGSEGELEYKLNFIKTTKEYAEEENFEGVIDTTIPKQLRVREMDIDALINDTTDDTGNIDNVNFDKDSPVSFVEKDESSSSEVLEGNSSDATTQSSSSDNTSDENSSTVSSDENQSSKQISSTNENKNN